jgi:hypothetical protein
MHTAPVAARAGAYGDVAPENATSGVSWPAVIGGAFAAAALSLILVALGSGFGLAAVSPWSDAGASLTTFTLLTAVWFIIVQWVASGVGGYLAGRLRTKWAGLHTHEVFFRDTANGFLSWAVASVIVAAFLASAAASVMSAGTHVAAALAGGATQGAAQGATQAAAQPGTNMADPTSYFVDSLYRSDHPNANAPNQDVRGETTRILIRGMQNGGLSDPDKTYLAQLVAARTGLSQEDAQKRVNDVLAQEQAAEVKARQAADAARKAGAAMSLYTGVSMLIGAFIACVAAALGGRQRDLQI